MMRHQNRDRVYAIKTRAIIGQYFDSGGGIQRRGDALGALDCGVGGPDYFDAIGQAI